MIIYKKNENIFNSKTMALVNPVNCMGIMGAGLAKEFKEKYPMMFKAYKKKCEKGLIKIGELSLFRTLEKLIINFPTKTHWRIKSKIDWIEIGLIYFTEHYYKWNIKSIAFPQLGCGMGNLQWLDVKILMEKYLSNIDLIVEIYII